MKINVHKLLLAWTALTGGLLSADPSITTLNALNKHELTQVYSDTEPIPAFEEQDEFESGEVEQIEEDEQLPAEPDEEKAVATEMRAVHDEAENSISIKQLLEQIDAADSNSKKNFL